MWTEQITDEGPALHAAMEACAYAVTSPCRRITSVSDTTQRAVSDRSPTILLRKVMIAHGILAMQSHCDKGEMNQFEEKVVSAQGFEPWTY
ncbi:MAG TPA: hypothetical protein DD739_06750 [Ochrobactrum anthropi]|nr:hypothetical protein [Brucella anthropi]